MMHPHEIEEAEYRDGPRLWDAGEGVCCAAYQLGGDCCAPPYEGEDEPPLTAEEQAELDAWLARAAERRQAENDACPF